ncbi:MAG TPA: DUF222 domain-containing protein [Jatrophihabitantaceae bacterium]|jgi:hypothetical protein|nr:DUF222 domain-containing protein [Jatrophihabitantaceae bacterium]
MSSATLIEGTAVTAVLDHLRAAVDEVLELDLSTASRDDLLELCRGLETQRRRLPAAEHRLIAELDERGVPGELTMRDSATLLARLLRLNPAEARARAAAAQELGPRRAVTGERLEPLFPAVAAAQAAGDISSAHARVITAAIEALPTNVEFEFGRKLEADLVEHSRQNDPATVDRQFRRMLEQLDPDGTEPSDREHQRQRGLHLRTNADGSGEIRGRLTPMAAATWTAVLDALSKPAPSDEGVPDERTAGQRRHDALLDAGQRLLRSDSLPDAGGAPVTVLVRVNAEDLAAGRGFAETDHGDLISTQEVRRNTGDAQVLFTLLDVTGGIMSFGRMRRLATVPQRRALTIRDGGCSFPGCTAPASWCETHHIIPWACGGTTDITNLTLLCGYHHREFERRGWECLMIDNVPHWRPPSWIDPDRTPRRNTAQHTELWFNPAVGDSSQ